MSLLSNIKRSFFYLDYLRMHSYARKHKLFKKNRYMISYITADDPKKGYKAYIQRIFRDLLGYKMGDFPIKKPRDVFGYNIGHANKYRQWKTGKNRVINPYEDGLSLLEYMYKRYTIYGENAEHFNNYLNIIETNPRLKECRGLYFKAVLDPNQSDGWLAFKGISAIADEFEAIQNNFNSIQHIQDSIQELLMKVLTPKIGANFYLRESDGTINETIVYTIEEITLSGNGHEVKYNTPNGSAWEDASKISIIYNNNILAENPLIAITHAICAKAAELMKTSSINTEQAFKLGRGLVLRGVEDLKQIELIKSISYSEGIGNQIGGMLDE